MNIPEVLSQHGFKKTPARIAVLDFLHSHHKPVTVEQLFESISIPCNITTIYRIIHEFVSANIIIPVLLDADKTYYECNHSDNHHHHIICTRCNYIEDVNLCSIAHTTNLVTDHSTGFSTISSHSLEYFGICNSCSCATN